MAANPSHSVPDAFGLSFPVGGKALDCGARASWCRAADRAYLGKLAGEEFFTSLEEIPACALLTASRSPALKHPGLTSDLTTRDSCQPLRYQHPFPRGHSKSNSASGAFS